MSAQLAIAKLEGYGKCQCGCGQKTRIATKTSRQIGHVKGQPLRFINGHSGGAYRRVPTLVWRAEKGRWYVYGRDRVKYPWARVVLENAIGRPLAASEVAHHINGDPADDRPENLEAMDYKAHGRLHASAEVGSRVGRLGLGHKWSRDEARIAGKRGGEAQARKAA